MATNSVPAYVPGKKTLISTLQKIKTWRYTEDKRDLRLDLLRGFAALAMIIDHVGGDNSWLYALSGGNRFFVSAAEGFVFVSGLVMGIVYAGVIARYDLRAALVKGAKRVGTLYCLAVGLSLLFAGVSLQLNLPWAPQISAEGFFDFVTGIITLHRAYYLTDVLILYTFVVAAALPLLALMSRGRGYGWLVLAGSWFLWAAWQWWPASLQIPWAITGGAEFPFAAWQVLFVTGLVIGYHRKAWARKPSPSADDRREFAGSSTDDGSRMPASNSQPKGSYAQWILLIGTALLFACSIVLYFWIQAHPGDIITLPQVADLFGKTDLRAGRLVLFACLFGFAFLLTTLLWAPIRRLFGWLLLPMGQDALTVYMLHLFVLALVAVAGSMLFGASPYSTPGNTLVQAVAISIVWAVVIMKARREKLAYQAAKAPRPGPSATPNTGPTRQGKLPLPSGSTLVAPGVSAGRLKFKLAGFTALALTGIGLLLTGPGMAAPLKSSVAAGGVALYPGSDIAMASRTALAVPTGGESFSVQATPNFAMIVSGTAQPSLDTPTPVVLPSYVQQRAFYSASLKRDMPYYVYLPPSYESNPDARYPVLYMLHGISGTYTEWLGYGLLGRARDMMSVGQISEYIIILPQGDQGYWVNQANGGPQWGTYVARDLVSEVDTEFRTLADREHRAVGGLSMGGYGALELAILYPDVFGVAGAHSPSLHTHATAPSFFGDENYFDEHDPAYLYKEEPDIARTLKLWIDDGQEDNWLPVVSAFQQVLQSEGIPNEWHTFEGGHDGEYWSTHVPDYLRFYSSALLGDAQPTATATTGVTLPPATAIPATPAPTFAPATEPNSTRPPRATLPDPGQ